MRSESLSDLADSLARERAFKGFVIICVVITLAVLGKSAHTYLPIILFALLADITALNRLRRLVSTLASERAVEAGTEAIDDDEDF